jgi:hypothetical protein
MRLKLVTYRGQPNAGCVPRREPFCSARRTARAQTSGPPGAPKPPRMLKTAYRMHSPAQLKLAAVPPTGSAVPFIELF